jgi:Flp pilus assembly protein TadG
MSVSISAILAIKAFWRRFADDRCGAAMVEFALAVPLFSVLFIGTVQGGMLLFDEIELANAANVGARAFAVSRQPSCNPTCAAATPATSTVNAIENSGSLTLGSSNITLSTGSPGVACFKPGDTPSADDGTATTGCLGALNSAFNSTTQGSYYSAAGTTTVTVTYPCPEFLPLKWMPLTAVCSSGNLSVTMSQQVQ